MKIIIKKDKFVNSLKLINNVIDHNSYNPILTAIEIEVMEKNIIIIGTNGNTNYKEVISEDFIVEKIGKILIKAKILFNILSKIDENEITIEKIDENITEIKTSSYSCNINLFDTSSFPIIEFKYDEWEQISFSKNDISNILFKISPFAVVNFDNKMNILNGVNFAILENNCIEVLATDSYKLGFLRIESKLNLNLNFTINTDILKIIGDIIQTKNSGLVELFIKNKNAIFKIGSILISFSLFTNEYPNVKNILFKEQKNYLTLNNKEISKALSRGSLFSTTNHHPVASLKIIDNKINVDFSLEELGNSHEEITIIERNNDNFNYKFNQQYLLQILNTISDKEISFKYNNENQPIIITSSNKNYFNLILPIKNN